MIDYTQLYQILNNTSLKSWLDVLPDQVSNALRPSNHGDLGKWFQTLRELPLLEATSIDLNSSCIRIGEKEDCSDQVRKHLENIFREFHPWRKGPFNLFGLFIDTEWRSDMKWDRLSQRIDSLKDKIVLDIGCGSGYHCLRMAGAGAKLAIGVDPTLLYVMQFQALQFYMKQSRAFVLPLGIDQLPDSCEHFDTVFSMGLLYHRRSPIDHLMQMQSFLKKGGQLVLETLVIDPVEGRVLVPEGRYGRMPNVWFIPATSMLETWLKRVGFRDIELVDVTKTTIEEQRSTGWMKFQSLADFLDPKDLNKTVEGYAAPKRAIFLAQK